jgi:hypothetical protein
MKYEEKLVKSVKNPDVYIGFDDRDSLSYLDGIADDSYHKKTTEGYITAAIISHQLTEQILLLLVKYSDLLIKARIYPARLDTAYQHLDTFGKLIERHATTVVFQNKSIILRNARAINKSRIQIVHKLKELKHEANINPLAKKIRDDFESLFHDWPKAMAWFYKQLDSLKTQKIWQDLLTKYSLK